MADETFLNNVKELKDALQNIKGNQIKMIIGLDGFVDEIIHIVDRRQDFNNFTRLSTIAKLGERITKASGLSTNIEMVSVNTKCGGNGPILSNALIEYGVDLTYIGALGVPTIHPVFNNINEKAKVYSISNPAHTDALEFNDGKLMLGKLDPLNNITWDAIKEKVGGVEKIAQMIEESDLFGMENWTMVPYMSDIWENIIKEVFPLLSDRKPFAFFDLADPEKRTKTDILNAMNLIKQFSQKFKVILGLNEKELYEISEVFEIEISDNSVTPAERLKHSVLKTYERLGIYCLVVHPTKEAVACMDGEYFHAIGPYCEKPVLTTGAGDNFNAGFCFAQALGLDVSKALLLGVSTSGYYVRNGKSPSVDDIIDFLNKMF